MDKPKEESPTKESAEGCEGVTVPEDFQLKTHALLKQAKTRQHVDYLRSRLSEHEDMLRKAAEKGNKGKPKDFNTSEAPVPSDY